ncbi:Class V chitinase CHIT5a [Camellia lanceoleosa]|uniref:Class V chitinase CHIT5a n=1 Tax=Camellia lanceoleosa TaxID=1840588 RepID=A0ACC0I811_9ERIC|nr:Class V chitinase CHIT5a [Camellia lanceoleosa]
MHQYRCHLHPILLNPPKLYRYRCLYFLLHQLRPLIVHCPLVASRVDIGPSSIAESFPPSTIPTKYFTHLFYTFVLPDATSYKLFVTRLDDQWMGNFTATLHAQMLPAKAFLSIGGGNSNSSTFSNMARSHDTRAAFIKSTIDVARKYGFDGLDLDWEFPQNPQDMTRFSMLFYEWRTT